MSKSKKHLVHAMRLYLGSVDYTPVATQQRLYKRVRAGAHRVAVEMGVSESSVFEVLESHARREGLLRPIPGKDY